MRLTQSQMVYLRENISRGPTQLSEDIGIPRTTIRDFYKREKRPVQSQLSAESMGYVTTPGDAAIRVPVAPLAIEVPQPVPVTVSQDGVITALLFGDTHVPHHDPTALAVVYKLAELLQPNVFVHMGDLLDANSLSRWDKDPLEVRDLQFEVDEGRRILAKMRVAAPNARAVFLEGNHEQRLQRTLWGLQNAASALNKLTSFQKALTWPALLDLDELGFEFVPYGKHSQFTFLPKFLLKHGDIVRPQSGYTARAELDKVNRSGASGHTHRLGSHFRRDFNGGHVWVETGCTCSLTPTYVSDPNWQQGCVVLSFEEATGAVSAELVEIRHGLAQWRGHVIRA